VKTIKEEKTYGVLPQERKSEKSRKQTIEEQY